MVAKKSLLEGMRGAKTPKRNWVKELASLKREFKAEKAALTSEIRNLKTLSRASSRAQDREKSRLKDEVLEQQMVFEDRLQLETAAARASIKDEVAAIFETSASREQEIETLRKANKSLASGAALTNLNKRYDRVQDRNGALRRDLATAIERIAGLKAGQADFIASIRAAQPKANDVELDQVTKLKAAVDVRGGDKPGQWNVGVVLSVAE